MNTIPPDRRFALLFALVTGLELVGDLAPIRWLHYISKPLIVGLLLAWSWRHRRVGGLPMTILRVSLVFALLGDVFLMIREVDLFGLGLASFLIMQLGYCVVFRMRGAGQSVSLPTAGLLALPFVVYAGIFLLILQPTFRTTPALNGLWTPVVVYIVCISTMGLLAALRRGQPGYGPVLIGALLFMASDSAIAVNAFLTPFAGATVFIMSTYAAAQYLIVTHIHPTQ
ncbi:lysoplasmalogenase [Spirosoma sp. 209]|uniref:lysoplasmalogenase n=1 Tax=Spirosoma sp. 209 TaxID=1955701 RepID=UPI00098D0A8D|nr:lysoplasmalogenase [Spirosoma sp. 209]